MHRTESCDAHPKDKPTPRALTAQGVGLLVYIYSRLSRGSLRLEGDSFVPFPIAVIGFPSLLDSDAQVFLAILVAFANSYVIDQNEYSENLLLCIRGICRQLFTICPVNY